MIFRRPDNDTKSILALACRRIGYFTTILFCVLPTNHANACQTNWRTAEAEVKTLVGYVKLYKQDIGRYPTQEEGLEALVIED